MFERLEKVDTSLCYRWLPTLDKISNMQGNTVVARSTRTTAVWCFLIFLRIRPLRLSISGSLQTRGSVGEHAPWHASTHLNAGIYRILFRHNPFFSCCPDTGGTASLRCDTILQCRPLCSRTFHDSIRKHPLVPTAHYFYPSPTRSLRLEAHKGEKVTVDYFIFSNCRL